MISIQKFQCIFTVDVLKKQNKKTLGIPEYGTVRYVFKSF